MSHKHHRHKKDKHKKHKKLNCCCDKPRIFKDKIGKGTIDSTTIIVPPDFGSEVGTETHPGPFAGQSFHPSSQIFLGIFARRNTPSASLEGAGKLLVIDKCHNGKDNFYKPKAKVINSNFVKKAEHKH